MSIHQSLELLTRPSLACYLFVPFTDVIIGYDSYGGGRYLNLRVPTAGSRTV